MHKNFKKFSRSENEQLSAEILDALRDVVRDAVRQEFNQHYRCLDSEILSCKQVEKLLGISHTTRIDWSEEGTLKRYPMGGRVYYRRSDIEAALIPMEERNPRRAA